MFFIAVGLADFSKKLDVDLLSKVGKDEFAKFLREQQKLSFFVVGCCILILILTVAAVFMFTVFVVDFDEHRLMGTIAMFSLPMLIAYPIIARILSKEICKMRRLAIEKMP